MRKTLSVFLPLVLIFVIIFSAFPAYSAVYAPDVDLYSDAYMLVNLDDDNHLVVAQKNPNKKMYPASLTKIVTAMVVLNNVADLNETATYSREAYNRLLGTGAQIAGLKVGDTLTIEQLLYLTLVHSACDATEILAEYVGGTRDQFIDMMNDYAASLGCSATNFVNPDGLHDDNHYTTPADMVLISLDAINNDTFMKIASTVSYKYNGVNYYHTNLMLRSNYKSYYYEYAEGIKTGSTSDAGYCVITKGSKDGYNYLAVVMGAPVIDYNDDGYVEKCSFIDAATLLKWAFNSLKFSTVVEENEVLAEVKVKNGKDADTVQLVADKKVTTLVQSSLDKSTLIIEPVDKPEEISAPVNKGERICTANVIYGEEIVAQVDLVTANDVELSTFLTVINAIKHFFSLAIVKIVIIAAILFVATYAVIVYNNIQKNKKRKRQRDEMYYGDAEEEE